MRRSRPGHWLAAQLGLQIEESRGATTRNGAGQRRLARLPRAEDRDDRPAGESSPDFSGVARATDHPQLATMKILSSCEDFHGSRGRQRRTLCRSRSLKGSTMVRLFPRQPARPLRLPHVHVIPDRQRFSCRLRRHARARTTAAPQQGRDRGRLLIEVARGRHRLTVVVAHHARI